MQYYYKYNYYIRNNCIYNNQYGSYSSFFYVAGYISPLKKGNRLLTGRLPGSLKVHCFVR